MFMAPRCNGHKKNVLRLVPMRIHRAARSCSYPLRRGFGTGIELYDACQHALLQQASSIEESLCPEGPGYLVLDGLLGRGGAFQNDMRREALAMLRAGHFGQSMSERVLDDGTLERFPKPGVFSMELEGGEIDEAPLLLHYTAAVLHTLPQVVNHVLPETRISQKHYGTKLACTLGGGAAYPKHIDNVGWPDSRKLTCVFYMNPSWESDHGGELRVFGNGNIMEAVAPLADRLVLFWSDLLVHEVLPFRAKDHMPTAPPPADAGPRSDPRGDAADCHSDDVDAGRRLALTLWLVTEDPSQISDMSHPLYSSRFDHFGDVGPPASGSTTDATP